MCFKFFFWFCCFWFLVLDFEWVLGLLVIFLYSGFCFFIFCLGRGVISWVFFISCGGWLGCICKFGLFIFWRGGGEIYEIEFVVIVCEFLSLKFFMFFLFKMKDWEGFCVIVLYKLDGGLILVMLLYWLFVFFVLLIELVKVKFVVFRYLLLCEFGIKMLVFFFFLNIKLCFRIRELLKFNIYFFLRYNKIYLF